MRSVYFSTSIPIRYREKRVFPPGGAARTEVVSQLNVAGARFSAGGAARTEPPSGHAPEIVPRLAIAEARFAAEGAAWTKPPSDHAPEIVSRFAVVWARFSAGGVARTEPPFGHAPEIVPRLAIAEARFTAGRSGADGAAVRPRAGDCSPVRCGGGAFFRRRMAWTEPPFGHAPEIVSRFAVAGARFSAGGWHGQSRRLTGSRSLP